MEERSERIIEKRRDKKYFAPYFLGEKFISGRRGEAVLSSPLNVLASETLFFEKYLFVFLIMCDFLKKTDKLPINLINFSSA
jgi:hypothetical protein